MDLKQIFENNFDCYAEFNKDGSCVDEVYQDEPRTAMAMTKDKFIEVVSKLVCVGETPKRANESCNISDVNKGEAELLISFVDDLIECGILEEDDISKESYAKNFLKERNGF